MNSFFVGKPFAAMRMGSEFATRELDKTKEEDLRKIVSLVVSSSRSCCHVTGHSFMAVYTYDSGRLDNSESSFPSVLLPHLLTETSGFKDWEPEKPSLGLCIWKGLFCPMVLPSV